MAWVDDGVRDDDIFLSSGYKDDNFSNIIRSQCITTFVNCISLRLVAIKSYNRELGLHLARVNLHNPDSSVHQLLSQRLGKEPHCRLGGAVNASPNIRLASGNAANIYNVALSALRTGLEDFQDGLRHVDETGDVGVYHDVDVFFRDGWGLSDAANEATKGDRLSISFSSARLLRSQVLMSFFSYVLYYFLRKGEKGANECKDDGEVKKEK